MEAATQNPVRIGAEDRQLHGLFLDFVDRAFPGVDFRAWYALGGWTETYVAHSVIERGVMVANASVTQMSLCIASETQRAAQLGAVAVLPTHRGRGLARSVVAVALEAARLAGDAAFLFSNASVLEFYPRFGLSRVAEHVFGVPHRVTPEGTPCRRLDVTTASDRALLLELARRSLPVSGRVAALDHGGILLWYAYNEHRDDFFDVPEMDAIVVARSEGNVLWIFDVLSPALFALSEVLPRLITEPVSELKFGFTPDVWWPAANVLSPYTDSPLFVSQGLRLGSVPFKYPLLAQT